MPEKTGTPAQPATTTDPPGAKPSTATELPVADASPQHTGTMELALFAPRNPSVELLAEWNGFKPVPMARGKDGWWRAKAELPDGTYRYRFRVVSRSWFANDQPVEVGDPYALETDERADDAIVRVMNGRRVWVDYQWRHDTVALPTNDRLVIYELHVGDFAGTTEQAGSFMSTIAKLDYLKDLGVNAIELMPVVDFPGRGWGYSLKSLFAIERSYGTPEQFCQFVDECHARGIRVIVDGVYNHLHPDAWMAKIDYELWFYRQNPDGPEMDWGPKFNYQYHDPDLDLCPARKYVFDAIQFMVEKYHIDGIRFDATKAIANFDVLRELCSYAYEKVSNRKPFICIAEHVPEDPAVTGRDRGAPMDAAWCDHLGHVLHALIGQAPDQDIKPDDLQALVRAIDPHANGYESACRMITFLCSHDQDRLMDFMGAQGKVFGEAAFRRMMLGHALILTGPGMPMIWMGSEFGMPGKRTLDPSPLDWGLFRNPDNAGLHQFCRWVTQLRQGRSSLRGDHFKILLCDQPRMIFAYERASDDGELTVMIANIRDEQAEGVTVPGMAEGRWRDLGSNEEFAPADGSITLSLQPSQCRLLARI